MESALYILVIQVILISPSVNQELELCELPEKDFICVLICKTKDFLQPVTFTNPRNDDVGSCIPTVPCRSNYNSYALSQRRLGNYNITKFHILKLSRENEEGKWTCSYGNRPSQTKYLTVHSSDQRVLQLNRWEFLSHSKPNKRHSSNWFYVKDFFNMKARPEHVDINVNEEKDNITINCSCYCVYPTEDISMGIKISNQEKNYERTLTPVPSPNVYNSKCNDVEKSVIGTIKIEKEQWPGSYVDISCRCEEKILQNKQTKLKHYMFEGVPKQPHGAEVHKISSNSATITWKKTVNGESRQTFVFLYSEQSTNKTLEVLVKEENNRDSYNVTLDGLKPQTTYQYRIFAYNQNGNSSLLGPFDFTTMQSEDEFVLKVIIPVSAVLVIVLALIVSVFIYRRCRRSTTQDVTEDDSSFAFISWGKESLSQSAKMSIENTKAWIKRISNETCFVETESYKKGKELLDKESILIYKGDYGDGRFTNAAFLLKYLKERKGYLPAVVHDITKWDEIVNLHVKMVLLIPDIVTKLAIDKRLHEKVYTYWEKMMSCVQYGKTKIIMTCQTDVMDDVWLILRSYDIFKKSYHIDMCNFKLTEKERTDILKAHCKKHKIEICTENDQENENLEDANLLDQDLTISEATISEIARTDVPLSHTAMGFPLTCELFCKDRRYTALGANFFLRPSKYIVDRIDGLNKQDDEEKKKQYELLKILWFTHEKNEKIKDAGYKHAIDSLLGTYIEQIEADTYRIKYETIYIAIGLSIAKEEPEKVIRCSNWNFFRYHMKSITSRHDDDCDEATFYISENLREVVTDRCLTDLTLDTICRYFRYVLECWPGFVANILNAIENKEEDIKNKYMNTIQKSCQTVDEKGIFVQACKYGNILAIQELKRRFQIPENVLDHCREIAKAKPDVFQVLDDQV